MMFLQVCLKFILPTLALASDCPGLLDKVWYGKYCCDDSDLGCYTTDAPIDNIPLPCCYDDTEVTFSLYTRANRETPVMVRKDGQLPSEWSPSRLTVFISHGWLFPMSEIYELMKDRFLEKEDLNVVIINWPSLDLYYPQSASETRTVGAMISAVMKKMVDEGGAAYANLWCVGHSLGAHVCAFAGRGTGGQIGRITGLDPAGPGFETEIEMLELGMVIDDITVGLNPSDAQYVDVIHTDTISQGTTRPLGHIDFYVNGREKQPGCRNKRDLLDLLDDFRRATGCSHGRAPDYFSDSIVSNCFISRSKCTEVDDLPGSCVPCDGATDGVCATMGYDVTGQDGVYYLETNKDFPPHCQG